MAHKRSASFPQTASNMFASVIIPVILFLAELSVLERSAKFIPSPKHTHAEGDKNLVEIMGNQSCCR